ncbi:MAG: (2Fe-2S) ferredoxin domain-containing protein [Bacteroidales bacterium]|nr:(2Fe-2S) ferredoxin domain-containing protein [Bacteroidales bacterium]
MKRINTVKELEKVIRNYRDDLVRNTSQDDQEGIALIKVAMATCSIAAGSEKIYQTMSDFVKKRGVHAEISKTGCMGYCYAEPTVEVTLPGREPVVFGNVDENRADEIIESYIKMGDPVPGIIKRDYSTPDQVL